MTSELFFTVDGAGEHPGPTYIWDIAPMPFWKHIMVLLINSIWNACFFHFLAWLHSPFKKYFAGPD